MSNASAVVVAAGQGRRMGADQNKVYLLLQDKPVLLWTLEVFLSCTSIKQIVVVVGEGEAEVCQQEVINKLCTDIPVELCTGGTHRQASVWCGLQRVDSVHPIVLVHDGARPLVSGRLIQAVIDAAQTFGAAVPGIAVMDSLKQVNDHHQIVASPSRENLYRVQTPQGFHQNILRQALAEAESVQKQFTDDAGAVAAYTSIQPKLIPGESTNLKITTPFDLKLADWLLNQS